MTVTAKDVAKLANVSPSTVSRVINHDKRISQKTRDNVFEAIDKLGYKVNNIARSLKTRKTHTIGFIAPEISEEFFMRVAKGAEGIFQEAGYSLIICNTNDSLDEETARIKLLYEKQIDGAIIIPSTNDGEAYNILLNDGIPVVLADRNVANFQSDTVLVDNVNASYAAIEHLIINGARRIGFIGGRRTLSNAQERYNGYIRVLGDYNIPVKKEYIRFGDFHVDSGFDLAKELLEQQDPPTHLFISNYYMHIGTVKYLVETEQSTPFSVSIASFDDMQMSAILGHASVTVQQPVIEIGEKAAKLLLERIQSKNIKENFQTYRLKPRLIYYK
jgi:LacI family transcriptional regulator